MRYKVGNPLPEKIKVAAIDMKTMEFSATEFVDVAVSYPQRPMVCSGCNQLGHLVGACPVVKRVWVQKPPKADPVEEKSTVTTETVKVQEPQATTDSNNNPSSSAVNIESIPGTESAVLEEKWTTVHGKKASLPKQSNVSTSFQMPIYSALSKSLSKGQLKRVRKAAGKGSPLKK